MFGAIAMLSDEQRRALSAAFVARGRWQYPGHSTVPEWRRCVNEGADGCTVEAGERGWCPDCWSTIDPEGA